MADNLTPEVIDWAQSAGMRFLDYDGEKKAIDIGPRIVDWQREPASQVAGRYLIVQNPTRSGWAWQLKFEQFYCVTEDGVRFYYYAPIPDNCEVKEKTE